MSYIKRLADIELQQRLERSGAVLVAGPKFCGKTETALNQGGSSIRLDIDPLVIDYMATDPNLILQGKTPRVIDEWHEHPTIWNFVRRAVDDRHEKGQFILTGSANPVESVKMHSGAGRISRMRMRPLSSLESGISTNQVSLASLFDDVTPSSDSFYPDIPGIADQVIRGGWPENYGVNLKSAALMVQDYVDLLADVDLSRVSDSRRDPVKVRSLLRSISRNLASDTTIETLTRDAKGESGSFDRNTTSAYLDALERLMITEDLEAFNVNLRSSATLRKTPKRHFVCPSIAVAALGANKDQLIKDLRFTGFLFESLVLRDVRIYADIIGAKTYFYRNSADQEVDIIVQARNGDWIAIEVKLGYGKVEEGAQSLLKFASKINTDEMKPPKSLNVITGAGMAHKRADGVNVIPYCALGIEQEEVI
jgi:predicted AAA+ superfamily ATPase